MRTSAYLAVAVVLVAFGVLAILTIGAPFLLTGLLMLALFGHRSRSDVMVPVLLWPWVFTFVYVLLGPLECTTTPSESAGEAPGPSSTSCTNVLGIDYSGPVPYSAPLLPALLGAAAIATGVSLAAASVLRRR
jgi:hypothetical protein